MSTSSDTDKPRSFTVQDAKRVLTQRDAGTPISQRDLVLASLLLRPAAAKRGDKRRA